MWSLDSSFCFDLLRNDPGAVLRAKEFDAGDSHLTIAAPALMEVLEAGYRRGGSYLVKVRELVSRFEVLEIDNVVADEAARLGGECARRGMTVPHMDLMIAAAAMIHRQTLVTRDPDFDRIPRLARESY